MLLRTFAATLALALFAMTSFSARANSASSAHQATVTPGNSQSIPLVFIHGLKGSELASLSGGTKWLTLRQALGLQTPNLALPLRFDDRGARPEDPHQPEDDLRPAAPLERITLIPRFIEELIYKPFLDRVRADGRPFEVFTYDWRRDNIESQDKFERFLEDVRRRHDGAKIQVVAHSMGGLIALAVLNRRPELFQSVLFAGVPFQGSLGMLPDLHEGSRVGLNPWILSAPTMFSFVSTFSLLPEKGKFLFDKAGQAIPVDFYSVEDWTKYGLSIARGNEAYLKTALTQAKKFRRMLDANPKITYPPIRVVLSKEQPTLARTELNNGKFDFSWDPKLQEPGDAFVRAVDAVPAAGIPHQVIESSEPHRQLLNDPRAMEWLNELATK